MEKTSGFEHLELSAMVPKFESLGFCLLQFSSQQQYVALARTEAALQNNSHSDIHRR